MKKLFFIVCFIALGTSLQAQAPESFNWQGVIRDNMGNEIVNQNIGLRFSILQGSTVGPTVYAETHNLTTTSLGLANVQIGSGTIVTGTFPSINWEADTYYLEIEVDPTGGTAYQNIGTQQLISVPYALFSKSAKNAITADSAGHSLTSDTASYSHNSGHALVSDTSGYSVNSGHALTSDTAIYSINSGHSLTSDSSSHSLVADSVAFNRQYIYLRKKATPQSISNNTNTQVHTYDIISSNGITINNGTGLITINESGVYSFSSGTSFHALNPGRKSLWFTINSSLHPGWVGRAECDNTANRLSTSYIGYFNSGDQISLWVHQTTGVSINIPNGTVVMDEVILNIEKLH